MTTGTGPRRTGGGSSVRPSPDAVDGSNAATQLCRVIKGSGVEPRSMSEPLQGAPAMSTQLLIYETAVPVTSGRHGKCSVEVADYNFSRSVNAVPLVAAEFPDAAAEYAIVFAGEGDVHMPVAILGAREKENLYLSAEGGWQGRYIPAFVRRYPFVFSNGKEPNTYTLCVDEAYQGLNYRGRGQPLFTEEGRPSSFVESVLGFLQEYTAQASRTQAFCKRLDELQLLEPKQVQFTLPTGEKMSLKGF